MESLSAMKFNEYIELLASNAPAPGGGSASALSGVQGTALISMVAGLTIGRAKYAEFEELNQNVIKESGEFSCKLLGLIDKDTEAYNKVSAAFKLPKETDEDKKIRSSEIASATLTATEIPFEIMETANKALALCKSLVGKSNPNAASDLGVSALNLLSCVKGAWLNVLINLSGIKDASKLEFFKAEGQKIADSAQEEADCIYKTVSEMFL
jgi:formiminotetrahydrofolate cyclodeaminase